LSGTAYRDRVANTTTRLSIRPQRSGVPTVYKQSVRARASKSNYFNCMFVRSLRVGTNKFICSYFSARQYLWPGFSRVLLSEKGTWGGSADGPERTRSSGPRGCDASGKGPPRTRARPRAVSEAENRTPSRAGSRRQPRPHPGHLRRVPPAAARRRHAAPRQLLSRCPHAERGHLRKGPGELAGTIVSRLGVMSLCSRCPPRTTPRALAACSAALVRSPIRRRSFSARAA
jgi:hypothetical protein